MDIKLVITMLGGMTTSTMTIGNGNTVTMSVATTITTAGGTVGAATIGIPHITEDGIRMPTMAGVEAAVEAVVEEEDMVGR